MGRWSVFSGAMVSVALLSFIDGMLALESFPFPVVVPFLLSFLGFALISLVDPFMLSTEISDPSSSFSNFRSDSNNNDPFDRIRHRASFVLGVMLLLISTSMSLTLNGFQNESTGCSRNLSGSSWPGFSLIFQGWCWLAAAVFLYLDKCIVARGGRGDFHSILRGGAGIE